MTSFGVALIGFGILFVACGVKDLDPKETTLALFTGKALPKARSGATAPGGLSVPTMPGGTGGTVGVTPGGTTSPPTFPTMGW